ncbi:3-oxoacyl-[acyl-carrier-protein] synthase 3 [Streptomyces xanthochromogenes]|uniref:3-oxoacyl-ACP synthase III family protein n=1 Tax=Streptomyces TaxID=1883 RepID=UPI001420DDD1|nr:MULTISPECIES: ketoacyl-ACP synthase III [Streptomyces]GHB75503.1 3-oxoacyl-[acyl-carrier-protein] synthase 3 [Streptomyces xanthochromogenes]
MPVGIIGLGAYAPPRVIDNEQISTWTGVTPEWIAERTGVHGRHYADPGVTTSAMAARAVEELFADSPHSRERVGLTVLATSTPDQPQPATAVRMQKLLRMHSTPAFDVNAVCSGFVYGLTVAESMLRTSPDDGTALVIGADMYSSIMDRGDRRTVSLFGDGAAAVLLGEVPEGYGIHATRLYADGDGEDLVEVAAGGTRETADDAAREAGRHFFRMQGRSVKEYALQIIPKTVDDVLSQARLEIGDIDRVFIHQGNTRLVEAVAAQLGVDMSRVPLTAPQFGNTGAASIPFTLRHSHRERPIERGERILFAAVGGGMTAGAAVLTWY